METSRQSASRPSPRLPHELLRHIFLYLRDPRLVYNSRTYLRNPNKQLDLIAASMVSLDWYGVARTLLTWPTRFGPVFEIWVYAQPNLYHRRLAYLLSASKALGLPYCNETKYVTINVNEYVNNTHMADQLDCDALLTILRLTRPAALKIEIDQCYFIPSTHIYRDRFFTALALVCVGVPDLRLYFSCNRYLHDDPHMASLVRAVCGSLTTVEVRYDPDALTRAALSTLPAVRHVIFNHCQVQTMEEITRGLRKLQKVVISGPIGSEVERFFDVLREACSGELKEISLLEMPRTCNIIASARALERLMGSNGQLKRLQIGGMLFIDDDVLRVIARRCREIEVISIQNCDALTCVEVWDGMVRPWPRLRSMDLCGRQIAPDFLESVVKECGKLQCLRLSEELVFGENRVSKILQRYGIITVNEGRLVTWEKFRVVSP